MTEHTVDRWILKWDDREEYVIFKGYNDIINGAVIEFALDSPSYARLYYALKDWYGD